VIVHGEMTIHHRIKRGRTRAPKAPPEHTAPAHPQHESVFTKPTDRHVRTHYAHLAPKKKGCAPSLVDRNAYSSRARRYACPPHSVRERRGGGEGAWATFVPRGCRRSCRWRRQSGARVRARGHAAVAAPPNSTEMAPRAHTCAQWQRHCPSRPTSSAAAPAPSATTRTHTSTNTRTSDRCSSSSTRTVKARASAFCRGVRI
jgi:hypothetical protein